MKNKKSISVIKKGMNRQTFGAQLEAIEYSFAANINTSNQEGESLNVQIEPSNYFAVLFPQDYKVIGFRTDLISQKTYYFLVSLVQDIQSVHYKRSSIGVVDFSELDFNPLINSNQLKDCVGCEKVNVLGTPLEDIIQAPSLEYKELLHDRCISLSNLEEQGLNFNINFPAKKIEINQEKQGTTLYWDDNLNFPRFLNVTDVEKKKRESYVFEVNEPCEDTTYQNCLNVDKLRLFPKHNRLKVEAEEVQTGGSLKMGTYEFRVAYCDLQGNEMTEYSTPTNPISIWDENNNIQGQTETDEFTNFSIKLKVKNLDFNNFKYYKVAVIETNNVSNSPSVFLAGIYPTTDNTVIYTQSGSVNDNVYLARGNASLSKRMDLETLNTIKPEVEKAKGTMVSGDILWHYGITQKEEINLQPVFNLFGALLHAQTSASSENLYKNGVATAKFKEYPRNEVIPFGVRLLYNDGGYSPTFPLIARPALPGENRTLIEDVNYSSTINNTSCIKDVRNKKWQLYNTAIAYEDLCTNIEEGATETTNDVTKTCTVESVAVVAGGTFNIQPDEEYYDFVTYINDNPEVIPSIAEALGEEYSQTCSPIFYGDCNSAEIIGSENIVGEVTNESSETQYETVAQNYTKSVPPSKSTCNIYVRTTESTYEEDTEMSSFLACGDKVYKRDFDFYNEVCAYSTDVLNIAEPTSFNGSSVVLNYAGADTEAELLSTLNVENSTITGEFKNKLHKKAQFFRVEKKNRDKIVFEITKRGSCETLDNLPVVDNIRYTIYNNCSSNPAVLGGGIVDLNVGILTILNTASFPSNFFIALDSPILSRVIDSECSSEVETLKTVYLVTPPCGCFSIYTRDEKIKNIKVTYGSVRIDKVSKYESKCTFKIPKVDDCGVVPYRKFQTAYWESTEIYDDNKELWDSSTIKIRPGELEDLSERDLQEFLDYYVQGGFASPKVTSEGFFILKQADFRCEPIRHFKMPDNSIAPYVIDNINFQNDATSIIFPLGVELDSAAVRTAINIAYTNNLITKKQRDSIQGFEIMRGDLSVSKSVIASGLAFDMYNFEKEGDKVHFSNFPFNDLGENKFLVTEKFGKTLVDHPYASNENYMYSFLSPDLFYTKPSLPTEAILQGYLIGATKQQFASVEDHSEWTVLGDRARKVALALATAEVALEFIANVASFTTQSGLGNLFFNFGLANGSNAPGATISTTAIAVYGASQFIQGITQVGKYRYEWLKTFRDLGRTYNFASTQVGTANYNKLLTIDQYSQNYLRKLAVKKYLKDGYVSVVDENTGESIKINNKSREESVLLSFGKDFKIQYDPLYKNIDNNKLSSNSSNFLCSEVNKASNKYFTRNVASPYFTLKNHIPNQWGTIGSIKWLTTNSIFDINENTSCKPIYGGTHVISRFSWRRKVGLFTNNAVNHPDKLPFMYSEYDNIAYPRFYGDYELTDGDSMWQGLGIPYPDIESKYNFDCETGRSKMYVKSPSKLYTSIHGIVDFLVESEINCNFRYARKETKDWFYPQAQDLPHWLQETRLPLVEPNSFFYNNTYSRKSEDSPYRVLDKTYSKELWKKRTSTPNSLIWSQKDNNENDLLNAWRVYKPLDFYEFKTSKGGLVDLHSIENNQFFARFSDSLALLNVVDSIAERITPENKAQGTGVIFSRRPLEYNSTDLGNNGTQSTEIISTPYGHFWCDSKRGRIYRVDPNGQRIEAISERIGQQPSGMADWFREHLPFKILKQYSEANVDNKFKGLGLNMWWDDREERLFITKKDYIAKTNNCLKYDKEIGFYNDCEETVISCPQGYTYNEELEVCELIVETPNLCPTGYTYNSTLKQCEFFEEIDATCTCTADVIATPQTICSGDTTSILLTSTEAGISYTWTVVQSGVIGATSGTGNTIIQTLSGNGTVTYTITPQEIVSGCSGTPINVIATVNPLPMTPVSGGNQIECASFPIQTLIATATVATGESVKWYDALTGGNVVTSPTLNAIGNITYYAEAVNDTTYCVSPSRVAVTLSLKATPNVVATPSSLDISDGDTATINLTSDFVGTTFAWTVVNSGTAGATNGSGNTISQVITGEGTATYTITPTLNGCVGTSVQVTVNVSALVISNTTQINIWFDNSGSMNSTLSPLQTMATTILKPCLLPAYNNDSALYDSRVQVQNFDSVANGMENYIRLLGQRSSNPQVTRVINLTFQDESTPYNQEGVYNTPPNTLVISEINFLRTTLETGTPNSLVGVAFQVSTAGFNGFRTFVNNVHTGVPPFNGTSGLSDKTEIGYQLDVVPGSTPQYYANLIVTALNNLGFALNPC